jgi:2-C-methyl-D-erythritol 2,4-cyclodiphosphate synthase
VRVGFGYDIHPLVEGRALILGGVRIPGPKGLMGHSDADALCHAVSDALLGAAALGDIGERFPDTDPKFKDADSLKLLAEIGREIRAKGYAVVNVDATVIAETPRLSPYKAEMTKRIASALGVRERDVSVKAKTNERFDAVGRGEAVAAYAAVLLEEIGP